MQDEKKTQVKNVSDNVSAPSSGSTGFRSKNNFSSPYGQKRTDPRDSKFSDFDQKSILIRRVTRVMAGGRRFSLSALVAVGDKNGRIGLGSGKAIDTTLAINKAVRNAKKNMISIGLTKDKSIAHDVKAKYASSRVFLFPNKSKGLVAGSAVRDVLILAGIKNVTAKVLSGSKNRINIAYATLKALSVFSSSKNDSSKIETEDVKKENNIEILG